MHEFLQLMIEGNRYGIPNLILMTALLFLYLFLHDKQSIRRNTIVIITIFCFSHISSYLVYSYTTAFDYMLHPMYFLSIYVLILGLFLYYWQRNLNNYRLFYKLIITEEYNEKVDHRTSCNWIIRLGCV